MQNLEITRQIVKTWIRKESPSLLLAILILSGALLWVLNNQISVESIEGKFVRVGVSSMSYANLPFAYVELENNLTVQVRLASDFKSPKSGTKVKLKRHRHRFSGDWYEITE